MKSVSSRWIGACLALAFAVGCQGRTPAPTPADPDPMNKDTYVIGASDVLQVQVWRNPELSVQSVPVRTDGKITVPLLDDIQAEGLTSIELKEIITEALSEYVTEPDVTVIVTQQNSKRIYVMGAVPRPGAVALQTQMRVLDALAVVGGFSTFAKKSDVRILRRQSQGVVEYQFDYDAYMAGRTDEGNLVLVPGDTIVVKD